MTDYDDSEFWVREPTAADQQAVYFRVIQRKRAEIAATGDASPRQISLYQVWQTDRQSELRKTNRNNTPWAEEGAIDD